MEIGHKLRIKYGLNREPTAHEMAEWARVALNLIGEGHPPEEAGETAAKYQLPGYRTNFFRSEADNIQALLRELGKK